MSDEHREEALRLIQVGHGVVQKIRDAAPEDRDPYGKQAMGIWAQAQVHATLAVAAELHTLNSDRSQWYREVLEVLTQAKEPEGSLRSRQPEAAPGCSVCGNVDISDGDECLFSDLTRTEWLTHRQCFFEAALSYRTEYGAGLYADQRMMLDFGPCPEES